MSSIVETLVNVADVEVSSVKTIKYTDRHKLCVYMGIWVIDQLKEQGVIADDQVNARELIRTILPVLNEESDEEKGKYFSELEKSLRKANSKQAIAKMEKEAAKEAEKAAKAAEKAAIKAEKEAKKLAEKEAKAVAKAAEKAAKAAAKAAEKAAAKKKTADAVQELIRLSSEEATSGEQKPVKKARKTKKDKEVIATQSNMIDELCALVNNTPATEVAAITPAAPAAEEAYKKKAEGRPKKEEDKKEKKEKKEKEVKPKVEKAKAEKKVKEVAAVPVPAPAPAPVATSPKEEDNVSEMSEEVIEDNFEENYAEWEFNGEKYYKNKTTNEVVCMNADGDLEMIGVYNAELNQIVEEDDE